jgi:tetratricopeptide (TPR) repeat protein
MKKGLLIIYLLFFGLFCCAQNRDFAENITGVDTKVDSLPYFMFSKAEYDSLIMRATVLPTEADMLGINSYMKMEFRVDVNGNVKNVKMLDQNTQINHAIEAANSNVVFETNKAFFEQAKLVLKETSGLWVLNSPSDTTKWLYAKINMVSEQYQISEGRTGNHDNSMSIGAPMSQNKIKDLYNVGVSKMGVAKYKLATAYFLVTIHYTSKDIDAYYNLGVSYVKQNDFENACKAFKAGREHGDSGVDDLIKKYCK